MTTGGTRTQLACLTIYEYEEEWKSYSFLARGADSSDTMVGPPVNSEIRGFSLFLMSVGLLLRTRT